jgi:3-dehydroquinate synthase
MVGAPVKAIRLELHEPYDVLVGHGLLDRLDELVEERSVAIVTDSNVGPRYAERLCGELAGAGKRSLVIEVPAGEDSKSLAMLEDVLRRLARAAFGRDCAVLSLGGGVVSDLAGFAAASYLRGVAFYSCPTSLLAMVDASVGGKTGVNLPEGKNLVGAFWQPRLVVADIATLATLPERQFREGAVELFKHGLLGAGELLGSLDDPEFRPGGAPEVLERYVVSSVMVKGRVVEADEHETGQRAFPRSRQRSPPEPWRGGRLRAPVRRRAGRGQGLARLHRRGAPAARLAAARSPALPGFRRGAALHA